MIRVFQRHCNFSSNSHNKPRPTWFDREKIFDLLISTLDERVEFTAFHDSGNGDIEDHFLKNKNVNKISKKGGNDAQSFLNLLNYVKEQNYKDDDIIYFLEDDYLHKPGWVDIILEGFEYIGADYYTLYDHPDKYFLPMYNDLQSKIIVTPSTHWRTTPSTTNTYACKFSTLKNHFDIHVQYCDLIEKWTKDHDKFTHLWKIGSNLISCIPGYSTHVEGNMFSPLVDWGKYFE
jgi:glycosyltransferase involved in cell wall biosynthesis